MRTLPREGIEPTNSRSLDGHHIHYTTATFERFIKFSTGTLFELVQNIIGKNLLTKFHDERTINTASRVLTRKNATPPWRPYIIGTNHLTKVHDDRTINVASRVLTRKNAPPPDIIRTNLLTKFHEDRIINVASREKCPAL
ncbi:hypothetical protein DPMN_067405 [Dreissena polymorpha]|uniref:Uncharacterized protein n=1 Tax=Dreissena polymorpha TaxID=45954 RepID=A0A9D3Z072_DREPO|nr:hypothetical protein DPMN_067405 [Dreissena polymorpha]